MLSADAIHPNLLEPYKRLNDVAIGRKGLLGGYSVLGTYLAKQIEVLKYCDVMFANDVGGDPKQLMLYFVGEMRELIEVIPLFSKNAPPHVDGVASDEAGDAAWFLAMRIGLAQINPEKYGMNSEETRIVVGTMQILEGLANIYPEFNPELHADKVAEKVQRNYAHRPLRMSPETAINEMAQEFRLRRLPAFKAFREELPNRKIPNLVYESLQKAKPTMPFVENSSDKAPDLYKELATLAREASRYYSY